MDAQTFFTRNTISFSEIVNGVPHGIALLGRDLRIVEMNRTLEAYTGYSSTDARGVLVDCILRSNMGNSYKAFQNIMETGEVISFEGDIVNKRHRKISVQFTASPLNDKTGKPTGVLLMIEDISYLQYVDQKRIHFDTDLEILGHSPKMQEIFELMPVLAQTDATILITGQTGTGKDIFAEAIHKGSKRSRHPFIKINCGALPEGLLESELFGHVRGAFTGAVRDKPGMFRLAQDGTLFLTEIGDLPLSLQVKLLSVLDDKEFYPVGGTQKVKVDVRIIAATHRSLRELVSQGKFREDLFYRLNVLRMYLPALSERSGDIYLLMDHFFREFNRKLNKNIKGFNQKTINILTAYTYPGNVRELRNIVEYAVNICQGGHIKPEHLPKYISVPPAEENNIVISSNSEHEKPGFPYSQKMKKTEHSGWSDVEKELIMDALKKTRGNRSEAARMLGWGRTTLWRKINRHGLA